jgi:hypothetical protein
MTRKTKTDPQIDLFVKKMFNEWEKEYDDYKVYCESKNIQKIEPKDLFMTNKMVGLHQFLYSL